MQTLSLTNLVLGAWLLIVIIRRQLAAKVIRFKAMFFGLVILFGLTSLYDAFSQQHLTITWSQALLFGGLSGVSAIGFGLLRALTYHLWVNDDGLVMRQGNWLTLVLWVISIGGHLAIDQLWTGSSTTLILYIGVTLLVQRGGVWWRAQAAFPTEMQANAHLQAQHHERRQRQRERD